MKKPAVTRRNALFFSIALACLCGGALAACSNLKPLTPRLADTIGEQNFDRFQFSLSKTITLTRVTSASGMSSESSIGELSTRTLREKIIFPSSIEGVAVVTGERLGISFEEGNDLLFFGSSVLADQKYAIVFYYRGEDRSVPFIDYGGVAYRLEFSGRDLPYLLVKAKTTSEQETSATRLQGRRIQ
jgi:hypothetical protein